MNRKNTGLYRLLGAISLCLFSVGICAQTSIAILDFELSDVTLAPGIPAEIARTASIKPMLEGELKGAGYKIIAVDFHSAIRHYHFFSKSIKLFYKSWLWFWEAYS